MKCHTARQQAAMPRNPGQAGSPATAHVSAYYGRLRGRPGTLLPARNGTP